MNEFYGLVWVGDEEGKSKREGNPAGGLVLGRPPYGTPHGSAGACGTFSLGEWSVTHTWPWHHETLGLS